MAKENKIRIYNRLFFKLYLNYAVMLLVTAVLICLIFIQQYETWIKNNHKADLERQAEYFSKVLTEDFIRDEKFDSFLDFYNKQTKFTGLDIWTVSNPFALRPMDSRMETNSYEELAGSEMAADYSDLVNSAFHNKQKTRIGYDNIYEKEMIIVAEPIHDTNGEVIGAVLLLTEVQGQKDIVDDSLRIIVYSSVTALAISFIIIIIFATELSLPITRMRTTALELAAGNYQSKTGIKRMDELGDLAKTVDILSDKLLENEIQRKNMEQMRLDFFSNVSHELRTPITVLRAYTETLVDGVVKDQSTVTQYYDRMLSECKSMERLVGDLLILSKVQNPDFAIEKEPVNLLQIFDDIIRSAGTIAQKKNITIDVVKESSVLMMLGDYDRLRQMFMVILDNAIKFSDDNKTVHIYLAKKDKIIVSIRDEGIGIEADDIPSIFEKFYKSSLHQNAGGTGLGLAIAKQIAIKHGGTIEVTSKPGEGSTFTFTFPFLEMEY